LLEGRAAYFIRSRMSSRDYTASTNAAALS